MNRMLKWLSEYPDGVNYTQPQGGLFIWMELPRGMDAVQMLSKAVENKVAFVPGTYFCVDGNHLNTIRLNFSNSTLEQIDTGMEILKKLVLSE